MFLSPIPSFSSVFSDDLSSTTLSSSTLASSLYPSTSSTSTSSTYQSCAESANLDVCDHLNLNKPLPALPVSRTALPVISLLDSLDLFDQQMAHEIDRVRRVIEETRQLVETCRHERHLGLAAITVDVQHDRSRDDFWLLV